MTKYYCDICGNQMFSANVTTIFLNTNLTQECDVCVECGKLIRNAKKEAEIETIAKIKTIKELRRKEINGTN